MPHRGARFIFRAVVRLYPREFRERFGYDLEADFAELARTRGFGHACWRLFRDVTRAVPLTHADRRKERARVARIRGATAPPGESAMSSMVFDARYAIRGLFKAPVFTVVTVLTLALGIGANSAIFSLVNAVLLRPLGYERPADLMLIHEAIPESNMPRFGVSPPDYLDLETYQRSFTAIGAFRSRGFELAGAGDPQQIRAVQLSASVFPILGVNAAIGRTLVAADQQHNELVAVLSNGLWQRQFGGRPDVIGARITLDRQPYTVVGVMPAAFQFPKRGPYINGEPADLWVPLVFNPFERQARGMFYNQSVIGRLRPGVTRQQASADTGALASRIRENYPVQIKNSPFSLVVQTTPFIDEISGQVRRPLLILLGAVGLVLLIACANVANLMLSRVVTRQREIGLRSALGAGRQRLFQMLLIESAVLAFSGGVLGLLLGQWVVKAMPLVISTSLPGVDEVALDGRVAGFTFLLSIATAVAFALVPLIGDPRRDLNDLLREGGARAIGGLRQHRVQAALVITSVAFAFVLLVGAGLLMRSFSTLTSIAHGIRAENVLAMQVSLPAAGYSEASRVRSFYQTLHEHLMAIPGVSAASISSDLPIKDDGERRAFTPERQGDTGGLPPSVAVTWIHGDYFGTFGVPIVKGRTFLPEEQRQNRSAAIVSRGLAQRFWPDEDPIGKRVRWGIGTSEAPWMTIVGMAGDVIDGQLGRDPVLHIYVPYSEVSDRALAAPIAGLLRRQTIALHTEGGVEAAIGPARAAVAALDPMLAVADVTTMAQVVADESAPQRFSAMVLAAFAGGALLLAAIGLYGVLAFGVSQRTREIGVRLALGAARHEVRRLVVREGMILVGLGLVVGCAGALAATSLLQSLLYETNAHDPWTFALVPLVLAAVALAACYVPAHRASRVDPMAALRAD